MDHEGGGDLPILLKELLKPATERFISDLRTPSALVHPVWHWTLTTRTAGPLTRTTSTTRYGNNTICLTLVCLTLVVIVILGVFCETEVFIYHIYYISLWITLQKMLQRTKGWKYLNFLYKNIYFRWSTRHTDMPRFLTLATRSTRTSCTTALLTDPFISGNNFWRHYLFEWTLCP